MLKEKRKALISHGVTRGLDPTAKLKPSSIEWLGDVPKHWRVTRLSFLVNPSTSISYGVVQAGPNVEDGIPYTRTGGAVTGKIDVRPSLKQTVAA